MNRARRRRFSFHSPGRRPGHRRRRVANPPQRGCLRGSFCGCLRSFCGCLRSFCGCLRSHSGCLRGSFGWCLRRSFPRAIHVSPTCHPRISHVPSTYLPRSCGFATRLRPVAGLQPASAQNDDQLQNRPFGVPKRPVLASKTGCFAMQNGTFCKATENQWVTRRAESGAEEP